MQKKIHPADQMDRDLVSTAVAFNTFFRLSPTAKISRPGATLSEAISHSDAIIAEMAGRKNKVTPIIYAIQASGSQSPVPADMIAAARSEVAMQAKAEAETTPRARKPRAPAADSGLPQPPDFSADTHKPFRKKLAEVVAMVEAKDVEGLKSLEIKTYSSSPRAIAKYRDAAVRFLSPQRPARRPLSMPQKPAFPILRRSWQ